MALGVLNNLSAIYAENNLNNTSNSLQTVLQQLSSGSRINSGADDSAGLSLVNGLQANSTALTQSATNAQEGIGLLKVADGALSQVTNLLNRAITLATEASNGTLNGSQSAAANQEYQSILAEINNIGSTTTYNQQTVFGGGTVAIYTGDSSTTGSSIDNLSIRALSSSNVGSTGGVISYSNGANNVFIDLSKGGINAAVTDSFANTSTTMNVNYLTKGTNGSAISATAAITVGAGTTYANTAQGLIDAINDSGLGLSATFASASHAGKTAVNTALYANTAGGSGADTGIMISGTGVGTGTNGAGEIGTLTLAAGGDALGGTLNIKGSDGANHAIALGAANSTDNLANLASTVNQGNYGITATVLGTSIKFTSANSAVTVSGSGLTDQTSALTADSAAFLVAPGGALGAAAAGTVGTIKVGKSNDQLTGGTITIQGDLAGAATVYTMGLPGKTDTLANLANSINSNAATTGISASIDALTGKTLTLTALGTGGTQVPTLANTVLTAVTPAVTVAASLTGTPTTNGSNSNQVGTFTVAGANDALTGTLVIGGNTVTLGTPGTTDTIAHLNATINAGALGVSTSLDSTGKIMTFTSANSAMTFAGAPLDGGIADPVLTTGNTSNSVYYSIGITGAFVDSTTGGGTVNTGISLNSDGKGGIATTSYTDGAGENLSITDLSVQAKAQIALTALNRAITDVAALDGYIGGQINMLGSVTSVLTTQQQNVIAAQNAIQATDYASATSNMSKFEILSQTGIAALAQANSVQKEVVKLLQ